MLSSAEYQPRLRAPNLFTTTCTQPLLAPFSHEFSCFNSSGMRRATKPCDWNSPLIAHITIDTDASFRIRNVLDRPTNVQNASVVVTHKSLVLNTPAREIGWQRVVPEVDWRLDKIVCEHAAADNSRVVMIELNSRNRDAWSDAVKDLRCRQSISPRIQVTL